MRNPSSSTSSTPAGGGEARNNNNNSKKTTTTTPCCSKIGLKRGPWTPEEDELLANYIKKDGEGRWRTLPKRAGLLRCGKSCRLRWMNYLRPCVKRGQIAPDEEDLILRLHRLLGNRWSLIAGRIPGRTDNEIKNYWNTHLSKKLISQGIDPRTHKPLSFNPAANISTTTTNNDIITNPSDIINDPNKQQPSSSKSKNVVVPLPISSPNPNNNNNNNPSSSSSSSGLEDIIKGGNHNAYFANTTNNQQLLDQDQYQTTGTNNAISSSNIEDEDDINYCTDDVFSSFLNSLINEDVFASQPHPQLQHVNNHHQLNGIIAPPPPPPPPPGSLTDDLISSAAHQTYGFSGTGWENALLSNSMPSSAFSQINDPNKF